MHACLDKKHSVPLTENCGNHLLQYLDFSYFKPIYSETLLMEKFRERTLPKFYNHCVNYFSQDAH